MNLRNPPVSVRLAIFLVLMLAAGVAQAQLTAEQKEAAEAVRLRVVVPYDADVHPHGLRLHLYNEELTAGTKVSPFFIEAEELDPEAIILGDAY